MATTNGRTPGFVKESLEQAQARLEAIEKEASRVLGDLKARSKSSRKEVANLIDKLQAGELFESARDAEKELVARASQLGGEMVGRLQSVQEAVLRFVGVASRDQVEELVSELERISKRLTKLAKDAKAPAAGGKKKTKGSGLDA